jgi:hypothetical protein
MSMRGDRFYDVWGYRKDGEPFKPFAPFYDDYDGVHPTQIDSSGSCFMLAPEAAPLVHFSPVDCILGIGRTLNEHGFGLWLDPTVEVMHP